jgi:hypothetical protein
MPIASTEFLALSRYGLLILAFDSNHRDPPVWSVSSRRQLLKEKPWTTTKSSR